MRNSLKKRLFAHLSPITCSPRVVSPRKVNRFVPLNHYYIIIDEVFFDNFLLIIYLLVVCKKIIIHSFWSTLIIYLLVVCKKIIIHSFWSNFVKDLKRNFSCKIYKKKIVEKDFIYYNIIVIKWDESIHFPGRNDPGRTGDRGETTRINRYYIIKDSLFRLFFGNYLFISCMQKKIIHSFWSTFVKDLKWNFSVNTIDR
jgi:hypothetical protein